MCRDLEHYMYLRGIGVIIGHCSRTRELLSP